MRWLLLAGALLAGCYSPSYRDCEITCASGACPSGFVCQDGVCRAEGASGACVPPDGPANDVDGDGVMNDADNCPNHANALQFNEDGDAFGDACDPCPPFPAELDNKDSDTDGVGDACDPDPNTAGNRIEVFEGFGEAPAVATAIPLAQWSYSNGEAVLQSAASQRAWLLWPRTPSGSEMILMRFTPTTISSTLPIGIGAVMRWDMAASQGIACWLSQNAGEAMQMLRLVHLGGTTLNIGNIQNLSTTMTYRPDLTRRGIAYSCSEPMNATRHTGTATYSPSSPFAGIHSIGVGARFQWIMIVSGP